MNTVKKAQDVPTRSRGPKTQPQTQEAVPVKEQHAPGVPTRQAPAKGGHGARGSHKFSQQVKDMQNALLRVGREFRIGYPEIFADSDTAGKGAAANADPQLVQKIQNISKHIGNEADYADGRWGPKTQDALNSVYEYIESMAKVMGKENDPKYVELLKQLSNTNVGPGKKFSDINPKDVNVFAKAITENISTMYTTVLDDLHKYYTGLKNKAPAQPGQPGQPVAQQPDTAQQQQPGAQQAGQQPAAEQGQATQVSQKVDSIKDTLQKSTGSDDLVFPFELTTDLISIDNFRQFMLQTSSLLTNRAFVAEMGTYVQSLRSQIYAVNSAILNWQQKATGTNAVDGGFSLNVNSDMPQFVSAFANADYAKARDLLGTLAPLCTELSNMVRVLEASPTLKEWIGEDRLRAQVQRGQDYVNRINSFITSINNMATRRQ